MRSDQIETYRTRAQMDIYDQCSQLLARVRLISLDVMSILVSILLFYTVIEHSVMVSAKEGMSWQHLHQPCVAGKV